MTRSSLRRPAALYALALVTVLVAMPLLARSLTSTVPTDPILGISVPSLTGYQATSDPTPANGVRPIAVQRGVALGA